MLHVVSMLQTYHRPHVLHPWLEGSCVQKWQQSRAEVANARVHRATRCGEGANERSHVTQPPAYIPIMRLMLTTEDCTQSTLACSALGVLHALAQIYSSSVIPRLAGNKVFWPNHLRDRTTGHSR